MIEILAILAQAAPTAPTTQPSPLNFFSSPLIALLLAFLVFYWIWMGGGRKDRQRREQMLKALKRNDRVETIGGLLGTVVDVRDNEVVLKVDEGTNTKIHVVRGAIKGVLRETLPVGSSK